MGVGWASYLDKTSKSSYNMNERPSLAQDGYYTSSIFSNPLDILNDFKDGLLRVAGAFPEGGEVMSRTIKPKVKDFDPKKRVTGIPGYNLFGAPGSKLKDSGIPFIDFFQ